MKNVKAIEAKIQQHNNSIDKFRGDKQLSREDKKSAIFVLQELIRQLKWVLK